MFNNKTQISWSIYCLCWFKYVSRLNIDKMMTKQVGLDTNSPRQSKALPGGYCPRLYKSADVLGTSLRITVLIYTCTNNYFEYNIYFYSNCHNCNIFYAFCASFDRLKCLKTWSKLSPKFGQIIRTPPPLSPMLITSRRPCSQ